MRRDLWIGHCVIRARLETPHLRSLEGAGERMRLIRPLRGRFCGRPRTQGCALGCGRSPLRGWTTGAVDSTPSGPVLRLARSQGCAVIGRPFGAGKRLARTREPTEALGCGRSPLRGGKTYAVDSAPVLRPGPLFSADLLVKVWTGVRRLPPSPSSVAKRRSRVRQGSGRWSWAPGCPPAART